MGSEPRNFRDIVFFFFFFFWFLYFRDDFLRNEALESITLSMLC